MVGTQRVAALARDAAEKRVPRESSMFDELPVTCKQVPKLSQIVVEFLRCTLVYTN